MSLLHKIAWRFAVIIGIIITTGLSIYYSINQLAIAIDLIEHAAMSSMNAVSEIKYFTSSVRRLEIMTIIADPDEQKKLVERQEKAKVDTKKTVEKLLSYIGANTVGKDSVEDKETEAYKKLLTTMKNAIDVYFIDNSKTIKAILEDDKVAWKLSIFGDGRKNYNNMIAAIDAVTESNKAFAWQLSKIIIEPLKKTAVVAERVAHGDLTTHISTDRKDEIGQFQTSVSHMQDSLTDLVKNVRSGSESVATASSEIAQGNMDLSARTESQASALEETAASMEELSGTVSRNADTANEANQIAHTASLLATNAGSAVGQVVETMKEINDSSKNIAEIISVIDGIAFQTNILALNAAVEAARAGEQGRGFAVVASEVRSLAGRSGEAAKQIKNLIDTSVIQVERGVKLADNAGNRMSEVVTTINKATQLVGEISNSSREQASGVAQVGEALHQMDKVTQQNAALVEQMAAAASSLKSQADKLVADVSAFKVS